MIHTIRSVAVGDQESKIDSPIILYRGDREVEVEFTINGSKFTFTNGGNVIKSTNATHGQLVINTPTGENMFSEVTECHDGKVVFVITKEMIDELIEVGFYSFQIRLFDESQVSRVTIPPVLKGIDIRNPIAAEDETNVVDIGLVDYAVVVKDEFEDLSTFLPDGNYNKTEWESKDVISGAKLNKIEDALYTINSNMDATDLALLNRVENINKNIHSEIDKLGNELESEVEEFEREMNRNFEMFKIDSNGDIGALKNAISDINSLISSQIINLNTFKRTDNEVDDTDRIQRALDYCVSNNLTLLIPQGVYIISRRGTCNVTFGTSTRDYCVYKENSTVKVVQIGEIHYDLGDPNVRPNAFAFSKCEVNWVGGVFRGLNNTGNKKLYAGNSIMLTDCVNSVIRDVKTYCTNGGPILMTCKHSTIENCLFENTSGYMGCCGAAFGVYSGNDNEIFRCVSYGGTGDGDISLYGTGERNKVTNSKCFSSLQDRVIINPGAQGICVDAGQNHAVVSECYAFGYYYGIDVKTDIINATIINNTVERCKVGLAARWGEAGGFNPNVTFRGNTILNPYNGFDSIVSNDSYWVGILVESTFSLNIMDNVVIKNPGYVLDKKGTGILIYGDPDVNYGYSKEILVSGNSFHNEISLGGTVSTLTMDDIYIKLASKQRDISIINNKFIGAYGGMTSTKFIKVMSALGVNIENNIFGRIDNASGGIELTNTKIVNFNGNTTRSNKGLIVTSGVSFLNVTNNIFETTMDWKSLIAGSINKAANFSNNIYTASNNNTGTLIELTSGEKLIATSNILIMNRAARDEFRINGNTKNVILNNNYIQHT